MTDTNTLTDLTEAELGHTQHTNTPPGKSLEKGDTVIKKDDYLARYNKNLDLWHVKRVVKGARLESWSRRQNEIVQSGIIAVSHNAVPEEGKSGMAHSHYPKDGPGGWGGGHVELSTSTLADTGHSYSTDANPWWLVDMADERALSWIAEQDTLWAEHDDDRLRHDEADNNTPESFEYRMERRALQIDAEAHRLKLQSEALYRLSEAIRNETRGKWIK